MYGKASPNKLIKEKNAGFDKTAERRKNKNNHNPDGYIKPNDLNYFLQRGRYFI